MTFSTTTLIAVLIFSIIAIPEDPVLHLITCILSFFAGKYTAVLTINNLKDNSIPEEDVWEF